MRGGGPRFTPPGVAVDAIVFQTMAELIRDFGLDHEVRLDNVQPGKTSRVAVLGTDDYAVKIIANTDPGVAHELDVAAFIQRVAQIDHLQMFGTLHGTILCQTLPFATKLVKDRPDQADPSYYIYMFMTRVEHTFEELPNDPKINEDFYFQILIGLYHARRRGNFVHHDMHTGNLVYDTTEPTKLAFKIEDDFFFEIKNCTVSPKLIDFGKAVYDPTYQGRGSQAYNMEHKRFWDQSDIQHLSQIFINRSGTPQFKALLRYANDLYQQARYAVRFENDSGANYAGIKELLQRYTANIQPTIECYMCGAAEASYAVGSTAFFCSEECHDNYY
jgi:hypothetical protein